jgi:hypothetical protein
LITIKQKGDYKKITGYLERFKEKLHFGMLDKYGRMGVDALAKATPIDTGATAAAWRYEIQNGPNGATISFHNDNVNGYVNIAIILQYGHGTGTGGWVQGRDYINPAIQPIFDKLADEAWKEVTKV